MELTSYVYSNDDEGRFYQNCKFYYPWDRGSCSGAWPYKLYSENILFLLKIMQNEGIGMMTKGEISKIVNFMTP